MSGHDTETRDQPCRDDADASSQLAAGTDERVPVTDRAFARLKKRSEFLAVAKGARVHDAAFTLQAARRAEPGVPRFGLTVTKKTGNSVVRNRIRRRLREVLRHSATLKSANHPDRAHNDYVIVARAEAMTRGFADLARDLDKAIDRIDGRLSSRGAARPQRGPAASETRISQNDERPGPTS